MARRSKWPKYRGVILCAGKSDEHVELLKLAKSGIHVASYWTELMPRKLLEKKLHEAVKLARARQDKDAKAKIQPPKDSRSK